MDVADQAGTVQHNSGPWKKAASTADDLESSMRTAKSKLQEAHQGLTSAGKGLDSVTKLQAIRPEWEKRLTTASSECGDVATKLRANTEAHQSTEERTKSSYDASKDFG